VDHEPSSIIDLDAYILGDQGIESVFHIVASQNNIGNYSYEYEVLESSLKLFSEPTGIAHEFICEEGFDLDGFKVKQNEQSIIEKLQSIATQVLNIDDLADNEDIQNALLQAYQAGVSASIKTKDERSMQGYSEF
jgi:hypothetical protein